MEPECSFDELLCQSLLLFRQHKIYGDEPECEEKASLLLRETRCLVTESKDNICMAKWGCVVESLAQRCYINNGTDAVLENVDVSLIAFWKKAEHSDIAVLSYYLWIGNYFLFRFRNTQSCFHSRSKHMIINIVSFLTKMFRKYKKQTIPDEVVLLFPTDAWGDTVYWAAMVHDTRICEKQSAKLLEQLYNLKKMGLQQGGTDQNILLLQILEFYCF